MNRTEFEALDKQITTHRIYMGNFIPSGADWNFVFHTAFKYGSESKDMHCGPHALECLNKRYFKHPYDESKDGERFLRTAFGTLAVIDAPWMDKDKILISDSKQDHNVNWNEKAFVVITGIGDVEYKP